MADNTTVSNGGDALVQQEQSKQLHGIALVGSPARGIHLFSDMTATLLVLCAALAIAGRYSQISVFMSLEHDYLAMRTDTALALLLVGVAFAALQRSRFATALALSVLPMIYSAMGLVENIWGLNLGLGRLNALMVFGTTLPEAAPQSVYAMTGLLCASLGVASLAFRRASRFRQSIALLCGFGAVFVGSAALLAVVADELAASRITRLVGVGASSAFLFCMVGVAIALLAWRAKEIEQAGTVQLALETDSAVIKARFVPWLVLALGLLGTVWLWFASTAELVAVTRTKFETSADGIRESIIKRLDDYESLLLGGRGMFAASKSVERDEWHAYVERLQIDERYPGVQGMGFSVRVLPEQKEAHIRAVRAEGFPEYTIHPDTERSEYTSIVYLEPLSGRNLRAFGFDMFTESTRRAAMERARDTNLPAISGKVTLVQETNEDVQAGFLLYVPVYKNGSRIDTVTERREALLGFVYSPFRANDLIDAVAAPGGKIQAELNFDIYDGETASAETLLYSYEHLLTPLPEGYQPLFTRQARIEFGGRSWQINFASRPAFDAASYRNEPLYILFAGAILSIFLFTSIRRFNETRDRALELARAITASLHASTERLRVSEQRFDLAVRGSHDGIWDWDLSSNSVYYSSRFKEMLGHTESEISDSFDEWKQRLHPADADFALEKIQRHFDLHEPFDVEFRLRTKDDEWRWFRARGQAVWNGAGKPVRMAGSLTDISEHKKVERMKSEFVATVSHELRTPLTAIRGSLGLISGGAVGDLPEKASELVAMAARNSERLLHLINDILDVEKIESGKLEFKIERLALVPLLKQAIDVNAPYAAQYGVSLRLLVAHDALAVLVDPNRFLQVMDNLLSNAIKFSPKAGSVEIRSVMQGARVRVSVVDHGPGIPEAFHQRIFQKFSQADSSSTRQKGGTGLGLSISKALVERFGGQLQFTSVVGEGTTFFFELPIALDASRTA